MNPPLEYHRPAALSEACELLLQLGPDAQVLAGGTDVLVDLRGGSHRPRHLVSLSALDELKGIVSADGELRIGALVTPAGLEDSEVVQSERPELLDAVGVFGSPQVRNRATIGGNLCTAASCGDLAPLLIALGARVGLTGPTGHRELPLREFFGDHRTSGLAAGEILVEVVVPARVRGECAAYETFGLRAENFITVAGVAAWLRLGESVCREARIALGAVAPTPVLVPEAEARLVGNTIDDTTIRAAALAARAAAVPISDVRGSADHRRELVEALCQRSLRAALRRAR
jgi:carbon-monoxide dehydrogenase medium subunit